jgi:S-adenosylmethionine:tRNA ribosyltransferase-isomerase
VQLQDFDFILPPGLIAQSPVVRRDQARLMVVDRAQQRVTHDTFSNIGNYLRAGDVLVVNDTKVIPARLRGRKVGTGGTVEVLLLHELRTGVWEVLLRPAAKVRLDMTIEFGDGILRGRILEQRAGGTAVVQFTPAEIYAALDKCGEVPLPPYIKRAGTVEEHTFDLTRYQTVYACHPGAVAAPTAGLHFTPDLLEQLTQQGITRAAVTLHVGWGTFQPIRTTQVEQHRMGQEFYHLTAPEAAAIARARAAGGRVVAVGTTVTRTLETIGQQAGSITASSGWSDLFIYPGYRFQLVDTLVTNFHLPRSTLFLLVCAFAGRELMLEAYRTAMAEGYRFYSYGDAMCIQ